MTNFDIAEQVADTSANRSQGSAQKELENYQKGIEYSLGQFKAAFQELSTDFITSDLIKGVVDFGTGIIDVLDATIGKFGALKTVIAGLGIAAIATDFMGLRTAVTEFISAFSMMSNMTSVGTAIQATFTGIAESIGISTTALGAFGIALAALSIGAVVFEKLHVSADEALESFSKQKESFESAKLEVDEINSQLEETQSKINALEAKGNLSLVEQEDLNNLKQQNAQLERTLKLREAQLKLEARQTGSEAHKLFNEWTTEDGLFSNGRSNAYDPSKVAQNVDSDFVVQDIINGFLYGNLGGESRAVSKYENFDLEANKDNINELIAAYKSYQKQIEAIDKAEANLGDDQTDILNNLEEQRSKLEGQSLDVQGYIDGYASVMQQVKDAYTGMQDLDIDLSDAQRKELTEAEKFLLEYQNMVGETAKTIQEDLDNIFKDSANRKVFNDMKKAYAEGNTEMVREIIATNEQLKSAYEELNITPDQVFDYVANKIDPKSLNISAIKEQLRKAFTKGEAKDIAEDFTDEFYRFIAGKSDEEIEIFYRYVNANNVDLSDLLPEDLDATFSLAIEASGVTTLDEVAEAFDEATTKSSTLLENIGNINSALDSQSTGKGLAPETYNAEGLEEYQFALERVNGTMQYNIDAINEYNEKQVEAQIESNNTAKALEQQKWKENKEQIDEYNETLANLDSETDEYQRILSSMRGLETENDAIESRCNYLDLYNQKLRESVGAYQAWLDAQNGGESGDMSSDVRSAMKNITDVWDSESDDYGKVGTHKYEAAVEFLVPDKVSADGDTAVKSYIDSLGQYFNGEKSGVDKFVQEGIDKQLLEYNPDTQELQVAAGKTMQDFADAMMSDQGGWTMEAVQAMFGLLDDYTHGDFEFAEVDTSGIDEAGESAKNAGEEASNAVKSFGELAEAIANSQIGQNIKEGVENTANTFIDKAREYFTGGNETGGESTEIQDANPVVTPKMELDEARAEFDGFVADVEATEINVPVNIQTGDKPSEVQGGDVAVNTNASDATSELSEVNEAANALDGKTATVNANINDNASSVISSVDASLNALNGKEATTTITTVHKTVNSSSGGGGGSIDLNGTAHASGSWGAKRNETALVGELGREIVVDPRTGKWHTVGDNGAEFTHIKRGDIIFNHKQTEELLARGFVNGRGSALACGTAHVGGVENQNVSGKVGFVLGDTSSSETKANTAATVANTAATKEDTKQKTKSAKSAKKLGDLYDWVAVRLQRFADKTKEIADKITDYVTSAVKTNLLTQQIRANQNEIGANQYAAWLYRDQANTVAKKTKMSSKLVNKAQSGAWEFENLSQKEKEKVTAYLKYYDKYREATSKVQELRNAQLELYEQWANMPAEEATKKIEKLSNAMTLLSNSYNLASSGASALAQYAKMAGNSAGRILKNSAGQAGYVTGNAYLDQQRRNMANQVNAYTTAYNQASANASAALANISNTRAAATTARNNVTARASALLSSKKIKKALNKSQEDALKAGVQVSTKGLSGDALKKIKAYNELVAQAQTASASAADAVTKYNIATEAQQAAFQQLAESQQEYAQMIAENEQKKFDNIKNFYDLEIEQQKQIVDNAEKERKYWQAYVNDLEESQFQTQIDAMERERDKMQEQQNALEAQLKSAERNGIIVGSEEWLKMSNQLGAIQGNIRDIDVSILELQDEMRNEVFYQALDKALKKAEQLRGSLSTIRDIITDEMMFDDDGRMTDFGITALAMNVKEYESYLDSMGDLLAKRQKYIDAFNNGNNSTNYSEKEFNEDIANIESEIQNLLKNTDSARKAIIDMVTKASKAELDAIFKAIEARQKLLKKQKEYYDYDKTLKGKTKDLQLLEQQERALQNSANAEDKAMLARVRAQRIEAQEALDETVRDHVYNLQIEGLDDLKTELQENYDNYVKDLSRNLELITETVNDTTESINGALTTVNDTIAALLGSYGVNGLTGTSIGLPTFAGGSRRVGRNTYGLTNERAGEIVIGDRGVFVPLSASSAVVRPELTNRLFDLADNYNSIMSIVGKNGAISSIQSNEGNNISPIINAPISIVGNQIDEQGVIRAINKQLPIISRTVQEDIRKDLRKSR